MRKNTLRMIHFLGYFRLILSIHRKCVRIVCTARADDCDQDLKEVLCCERVLSTVSLKIIGGLTASEYQGFDLMQAHIGYVEGYVHK